MSIKASKSLIGAFVLGALCLIVVGIAIFGSGKLFSPTEKFVMYFDGSVKGLSVGAPVVFRGVKIGSVTDIVLQGNLHDMTFRVPVIVEIDTTRFSMTNGAVRPADYYKSLIDIGLRAQLQLQSLVTGQLTVYFDFFPNDPARFVTDQTGYIQIPTIPSTSQELAQKLEELPVEQLVERANAVVGGLERLVNSPDLQDVPRSLNLTMADTRTLLKSIDREIELLSSEARRAMRAATATIKRTDQFVAGLEAGGSTEIVKNINQTLLEARESLRKLDDTLASVQNVATDERSGYQLRNTLKDLGEAARALGSLVGYLDRHPEALLRGKTNLEEK